MLLMYHVIKYVQSLTNVSVNKDIKKIFFLNIIYFFLSLTIVCK